MILEPHSIWMMEINHKNFFTSWQGLSFDLVHQCLPKKQSTILEHLQKPIKGLRSTQEKVLQLEPDPEQDQFPPSTHPEDTNLVLLNTVDITGKFYTNQPGRVPVTSIKGNKYILVAYHYDSTTINPKPLKKIKPWFKDSLPETPQHINQQRFET